MGWNPLIRRHPNLSADIPQMKNVFRAGEVGQWVK